MIDIKSLRIGSYVMYEQTTHVVTGLQGGLVWTRWINGIEPYVCDPKALDPIPLTEEVLLKCGFEKEKGMMSYILDGCPFIKIVYGLSSFWLKLNPHPCEIKHLHVLMNIIHDLTGKELKYELIFCTIKTITINYFTLWK